MAKKQKVLILNVKGRNGATISGGEVVPAKKGTKKKPGRIQFHQYPESHHELMQKAITKLGR